MLILDKITRSIENYRKTIGSACPFENNYDCYFCELLFPEIISETYRESCPCELLGYNFVKEEMRRLFPMESQSKPQIHEGYDCWRC